MADVRSADEYVEDIRRRQREDSHLKVNGNLCVYCKSPHITFDAPVVEATWRLSREVQCLNCKRHWRQLFHIDGVEEISEVDTSMKVVNEGRQ
jgi:hypothetical protein